ncbi:NUDIX hydrolase [Nostoc sp. CALU 546]|uniref:NUDIX hydrolase n=1 Tax=Nostoc sp. CALU 546 TaxID=1867241 RepID=UPI003B67CC78
MTTKPIKKKVIAYITRDDELMVFRHTDFPAAGVQVPAGTIDEDESPDDAVLREVYEESGLMSVRIVEFLGTYEYDMTPLRDEIQSRYVYHLELTQPALDSWRHYEMHPSTGFDPIAFDFSWVKLDGSDLGLAGGQGQLLPKLCQKMKTQ